jgi:hypothetical protein
MIVRHAPLAQEEWSANNYPTLEGRRKSGTGPIQEREPRDAEHTKVVFELMLKQMLNSIRPVICL